MALVELVTLSFLAVTPSQAQENKPICLSPGGLKVLYVDCDVEEGRFGRGMEEYVKGKYALAAAIFLEYLKDVPNGAYREDAYRRLYIISNELLKETSTDLQRKGEESCENALGSGLSGLIMRPKAIMMYLNEACALYLLDKVAGLDAPKDVREKAHCLAGNIHFLRERYHKAEQITCEMIKVYPKYTLPPSVYTLAISSKMMKLAATTPARRDLLAFRMFLQENGFDNQALRRDRVFLIRQLAWVTMELAECDYTLAESLTKTGHPFPAGLIYGFVRLMYPGTPYADKAIEKLAKGFPLSLVMWSRN